MAILEGIRVLDFGRYIAGPFCGALLADLGADVIRIEKLAGSEDRYTAPVGDSGVGSVFLQMNRNKRGFTFNPKKPGADRVRHALIASADVVLANMPPSGLEDMGISYGQLTRIKPDIILASSTAFGSRGPFGERVGFDGVAQAMSGNLDLSGEPDRPARNYFPYVDYCTGALNAVAVLGAIMHHRQTGAGQEVQGALLASALTIAGGGLIEQAVTGINRTATGNRGQTSGPSDTFRTRDGWVLVSVVGNPLFERWVRLVEAEDWLTDPRFASDEARGRHGDLIGERMQAWTGTRTTDQVLAELESARIPCGPVLTLQQALDHEQVGAMGFLVPTEYPGVPGTYLLPRLPLEFSASPPAPPRRPPTLGEHTDEILSELGFGPEEINRLHQERIV